MGYNNLRKIATKYNDIFRKKRLSIKIKRDDITATTKSSTGWVDTPFRNMPSRQINTFYKLSMITNTGCYKFCPRGFYGMIIRDIKNTARHTSTFNIGYKQKGINISKKAEIQAEARRKAERFRAARKRKAYYER